MAMGTLGNGLQAARQFEDELSIREAELSTLRRVGDSECNILAMQGNLAGSYQRLGRLDEALSIRRDVYSGFSKLYGIENEYTLLTVNNYVNSLLETGHFEEAKSLLRKSVPVARRVMGTGNVNTLRLRWNYAMALYRDTGATLDDLREAVTTLEDTVRVARRLMGGAHPLTTDMEQSLRNARAILGAHELGKKVNIRTSK